MDRVMLWALGRSSSWRFVVGCLAVGFGCAGSRAAPPGAVKPTAVPPGAAAVDAKPAAPHRPTGVDVERLWQQVIETCEKERKDPCAPGLVGNIVEAARALEEKKPECEERVPSLCETAAVRAVEALPTHRELREQCARLLYQDGRTATAARILGGIPGSDPDAKRLLLVAAELHLEAADKGPNYRHHRDGMAEFRASKDQAADKRWVEAELEAAATAAQRAVGLGPTDVEALAVLATVREKQARPALALAVLETALAVATGNAKTATQRARLLAALGRDREAVAAYRAALALDEFAGQSWQALAQLHGRLGDQEARKQADERSAYYGFLMPSSRLTFTVARGEKARLLASHFGEEAEANRERWQATVAVLDRAGDAEAAELLASFARWHSHDAAEERAFAAIERQGGKVAPVLIRLVQSATSVCTIRQALAILSRLRPVEPETSKLALQALGNDRNPFFPIDAARALARLGDVEAVVPLLTTAGCEPLVRPEDREEVPTRVRGESLIAAAALDGKAAGACVAQFRGDKDLRRYVAAAACLAAGDENPCQELVKEMRARCHDTYFADAAILGFLDDWSRDRPGRKKWSKKAAASFKQCTAENEKKEKERRE